MEKTSEILIEGKDNKSVIDKSFNETIEKLKKSKNYLCFFAYESDNGIFSCCVGDNTLPKSILLFESIKNVQTNFLKVLLNNIKNLDKHSEEDCKSCDDKDNCFIRKYRE